MPLAWELSQICESFGLDPLTAARQPLGLCREIMRLRAYAKAHALDKQARSADQQPPEWAMHLVGRVKSAQFRRDRAAEKANG